MRFRFEELGVLQVGSVKASVCQVGGRQIGVLQFGPFLQFGPLKTGSHEVRIDEVDALQVRIGEVGPFKDSRVEARPLQVGFFHVRSREIRTVNVSPGKIRAPQVRCLGATLLSPPIPRLNALLGQKLVKPLIVGGLCIQRRGDLRAGLREIVAHTISPQVDRGGLRAN